MSKLCNNQRPYIQQQDKLINPQLLVLPLIELAKQRSVHPDKLLKGTALFYDDIKHFPQAISQQQWVKLVTNCHKLLKQTDISFLLGSRLLMQNSNNLLNVLLNCRHLADMLRVVKRYQMHICPSLFLTHKHHQNHEYIWLTPAISIEHHHYDQFMYELFATAIITTIKRSFAAIGQLTEQDLNIRFPYQTPRHIEQYQSFLSCSYQFKPTISIASLQIRLSHNLLYRPFKHNNLKLRHHYRLQLIAPHYQPGLLQYLHLLFTQLETNDQTISLDTCAQHMAISVATLKRKLTAHNCSFQRIFDNYRQQNAVFQLAECGLSNETVAEQMKFSDLTNFRRAIKRWTGLTPSALRKHLLFEK